MEKFSKLAANKDSLEIANAIGKGLFPEHMGIEFTSIDPDNIEAQMRIMPAHMAPNGFMHGGSVVALADSVAGFGNAISLPEGASGFTTIELKTNYLGTAREGVVKAIGTPIHRGKSTQVWDVKVLRASDNKTIALFRCTNMVLWPKNK